MSFLDLAIKSILAATMGWAAIGMLRSSSAATKHAALFITLIGVCFLPAASSFLPRWHVPFLQVRESVRPVAAAGLGAVTQNTPQAAQQEAEEPRAVDLPTVLLLAWVSVAGILGLRVAYRLFKLARAERQLPMCTDPELQSMVASRCRRSGKHVVLLEGNVGEPPMTWGFTRPVLVLPSDACDWPEDRLDSVVLHELAHIERGDWLASIVGQLACAVYWFNPFVWMISKRMEIESETAADDRVLNLGVSATQYASHLVGITRDLRLARTSTHVALAMARPGSLDRRVLAILEARRCRRTVRGVVTLGLIATVAGVVIAVGAAAPTMVREVLKSTPVVTPPDVTISSEQLDDHSSMGDIEESPSEGNAEDFSTSNVAAAAIPNEPSLPFKQKKQAKAMKQATPPVGVKRTPKKGVVVDLQVGNHGAADTESLDSDDFKKAPAGVNIDFKELAEEFKKSGIAESAEAEKALKELSNIKIDTRGLMEAASKVASASTKAAMRSAKVEIEAAMKDVHREMRSHGSAEHNIPAKHGS